MTDDVVVGRLVFDGQCGFCTRSVRWLERLDRHGRVDLQPFQADGVPASIGADIEQCREAVQWLGPDGVRRSGADAVNAVLDVVTGTGLPSRLYRSTAGLQERAYRWVAEHRSRLPGVTPHCQQHPGDLRVVPGIRMKDDLHRSLQTGRDVMVWKLDVLSEYDVRRPMTPTGTNLLGLVKHLAGVEIGYFGTVFGRPIDEDLPWLADDADPTGDLWATTKESRDDVVDLYRRVWAHSDATIVALDLDAPGRVPHRTGARADVTLHEILVHVVAETHRHAGHADIVREAIDGAVGHRAEVDNLAPGGPDFWAEHRRRLERLAREAGGY